MAFTGAGSRSHDHTARQGTTASQRSISYTARTQSDDSWVEIESQPSSSSLSSVNDEIITTGLRIQDATLRRKRRVRPGAPLHVNIARRSHSTGGSSQEEYEESESESDRVLTSSNEDLGAPTTNVRPSSRSEAVTDDEDENRTAVNDPLQNCFTPQPNAFSHPPQTMHHASEPGSYFPTNRPVRPSTRHSYPVHETRVQHSPFNAISPSHNAAAHHDAALRASLSNLLSYAAAARNLSKPKQQPTQPPARPNTRIEPNTLRLIPESELPGASPRSPPTMLEPTFHPTIRRTSTSTSASASADGRAAPDTKRKAQPHSRASSKERRAIKKRRASATAYSADELFVSPTLLTWVVSAGVVVVLSALSFSAGYAVGKEAGRMEAVGEVAEAGSCATEAGRGWKLGRMRFAVAQ
ncbi:hypothetical protein MBLNU457_g0668t1 [Dothideomycetes sp. NU457]